MATFHRKTRDSYPPVHGRAYVTADPSAHTGSGGTLNPQHKQWNLVEGEVVPTVELTLEGIGTLHLRAVEVKLILDAINEARSRSYAPERYVGDECNVDFIITRGKRGT